MQLNASLAALSYSDAKPATKPQAPVEAQNSGTGFVEDFAATLQNAEATAEAAMVGDADPQALVEALAQSQLAVETAVTLRNKVVEAYQEILRMPV